MRFLLRIATLIFVLYCFSTSFIIVRLWIQDFSSPQIIIHACQSSDISANASFIFNHNQHNFNFLSHLIYVITPTYSRHVQKAELLRLCHNFMPIKRLHWILVEDSVERTNLVTRLLAGCPVTNTHLFVPTSPEYRLNTSVLGGKDPSWLRPKGVVQRNAGLDWITARAKSDQLLDALIYFADDDNVYDLRLFDEIRATKRVSVWPVGLSGGLRWEGPICERNRVVGWHAAWKRERPFPLDMAGFAFHTRLLRERPHARFSYAVARGYQESHLLTQLGVTVTDLEPRANACTQLLVWHTRTELPKLTHEQFGAGDSSHIDWDE